VHLDVGGEDRSHFCKAEVLDDEGVDSTFLGEAQLFGSGLKFSREDEGVHGEEAFDPVFMEKGHQLGEIVLSEVVGSQACVEGGKTKEDGIGTGSNGRTGAIPVASWGQEFGV